ncbi:MAG: substrate-binding domain-containing protein [Blautia sp.]|nr:substrate-binding domain-containing protein [Blautia sp.]
MDRKRTLAAVLAMILLIVGGCGSSSDETGRQNVSDLKPEEGKNLYVIATVLSGLNYFDACKKAMETVEAEMNVTTAFVGPEDYNLEELISMIKELTDSGNAYGLILPGWEDALVPSINRAVESGMYVCTVSQDLPDSERMMYVGQDNYAVGIRMAELIRERYHDRANIVVMRSMSQTNTAERMRGMESVLGSSPDITLIADIDTKNDMDIARQKAAALDTSYPDADVIIAADGISSAALAKEYSRSGDAPLVLCTDGDPAVLEAVRKGKVDDTLVENAALDIYLAISEGERRCSSGLQLSADDKAAGVQLGISYIDTGFTIVNKENIDYYFENAG